MYRIITELINDPGSYLLFVDVFTDALIGRFVGIQPVDHQSEQIKGKWLILFSD